MVWPAFIMLRMRAASRATIVDSLIDGMPEIHATRDFARRHGRKVHLCFFNEHQRGEANWDHKGQKVQVNRTEALDASRAAVRDKRVTLPRRTPLVELFARHMSADAKVLEEDEDTGAKRYRYIRTGENHFSMAFTYAWMAAMDRKTVHVSVIYAERPRR